jgi:pyruvate,water dikinase
VTVTGDTERVLALDDPRSQRPELTGAKAAHLARASAAGLPTLPGFVVLPPAAGCTLTSSRRRSRPPASRPAEAAAADAAAAAAVPGPEERELHEAWHDLSAGGHRSLVVRSSSAQEDTRESSMAGQFASILDVRGWDAFAAALRTVRESAGPDAAAIPVLVQPMVRSRAGGVLFGADPVAGRTDRLLVSVVRGGPDTLVSGMQPGSNVHLSPRGRMLDVEPSAPAEPSAALAPAAGGLLNDRELRRLAALARRARRLFGGPQDIEFGFQEGDGAPSR